MIIDKPRMSASSATDRSFDRLFSPPLSQCPACGSRELKPVVEEATDEVHFSCGRCERCWHVELGFVGVHRTWLYRNDSGLWGRRDRATLGPIGGGIDGRCRGSGHPGIDAATGGAKVRSAGRAGQFIGTGERCREIGPGRGRHRDEEGP